MTHLLQYLEEADFIIALNDVSKLKDVNTIILKRVLQLMRNFVQYIVIVAFQCIK